jgi:hypothetical protein
MRLLSKLWPAGVPSGTEKPRRPVRLSVEPLEERAVPAVFVVQNLADAGKGSLRQAVLDANANPGADVIDFAVTGGIILYSGELAITDGVAINGPGAGLLTVQPYNGYFPNYGIFSVGSAAAVQISGLTLSGSTVGAITNFGTLTISGCTLTGNSRSVAGGAIYSNGTLTVRHSTISENYADGYSWTNGAAYGGGIYVAGGTLTLSSSTVANNAVYGGAYYFVDPDSPYWPNGGEWYGQDAYGGGVYVAGGTVSIDHSTIAGNYAEGGWGDGLYSYGYSFGGGVFVGTHATFQARNSIVADNTAWNNSDLSGAVASLGHNLIGDSAGGAGYAASDLLNVDPRLGPLQDNGGPTHTMALLAGSPALDAGDNTGAPAYDQRGAGFPRIFGDAIDIGAFEAQTRPLPTINITDVWLSEGNVGTASATFTVTLSAASPEPVTVAYATSNGSATTVSDFQGTSGTLTFAPGETSKTITVPVIGDRLGEPDEWFAVNLNVPTNATVADGQGVGTITDDEPRISIDGMSKAEGRKGQTTLITFTITLDRAYDQPVTVSFRTADGTAKTSNSDYIARTGTITFAPGETTKTITIEVKGDNKREADEYFYLDLFGNSSNSVFSNNRGIGAILNDD